MFVNAKKICLFKAEDAEIKAYTLCLGNISKDFAVNGMKEFGLIEYVYVFFYCL